MALERSRRCPETLCDLAKRLSGDQSSIDIATVGVSADGAGARHAFIMVLFMFQPNEIPRPSGAEAPMVGALIIPVIPTIRSMAVSLPLRQVSQAAVVPVSALTSRSGCGECGTEIWFIVEKTSGRLALSTTRC